MTLTVRKLFYKVIMINLTMTIIIYKTKDFHIKSMVLRLFNSPQPPPCKKIVCLMGIIYFFYDHFCLCDTEMVYDFLH